jgi:hypothetical protein
LSFTGSGRLGPGRRHAYGLRDGRVEAAGTPQTRLASSRINGIAKFLQFSGLTSQNFCSFPTAGLNAAELLSKLLF